MLHPWKHCQHYDKTVLVEMLGPTSTSTATLAMDPLPTRVLASTLEALQMEAACICDVIRLCSHARLHPASSPWAQGPSTVDEASLCPSLTAPTSHDTNRSTLTQWSLAL
jgi:hypothetical protein